MKKHFLKSTNPGMILLPTILAKEEETDVKDGDIDLEIKSIEAIAGQVKKFKELLGDKADEKTIKALQGEVKSLSENLKTWTDKEVIKSIESINEKNEKLHSQIVEMQEKLAEERDKESKSSYGKRSFVSEKDIKDFVDTVFPEGKAGEKSHDQKSIHVKAAEVFGYPQTFTGDADISALTGRHVISDLFEPRRKRNLVLDYFNIQTIDVPTLIYLRKIEEGPEPDTDDSGGAAWILCGDPKPRRSFRITTGTAEAKKLAIFGTIEDCLLEDVPSFERWIREDFMREMRDEYNNALLNNNSSVDENAPEGIKTNAIQYSPTPAFDGTVIDPNYIDAIIAAIALQADEREESAYAFVASDVFYAIHALKSSDGKWLNNDLVYVDNRGRLFITGVEVVPVDKEDVSSEYLLLVAADMGFRIYNYGDVVFERGLNGEDFREDKTSYRAYQRVLSFVPEDREASVLYDTWENIFAAIAAGDGGDGVGVEG